MTDSTQHSVWSFQKGTHIFREQLLAVCETWRVVFFTYSGSNNVNNKSPLKYSVE